MHGAPVAGDVDPATEPHAFVATHVFEELGEPSGAPWREAHRLVHFAREAMAAIEKYDWPGNVRELKNALERSVVLSRGDEIEFGIFGMRTVIGRSQDGADQLDIDLKKLVHGGDRVSRRHAEIVLRGADYFIRDLGSLNGTYIAGRGKLGRDQLYKLKDRDQVVLGGAILQFRRG